MTSPVSIDSANQLEVSEFIRVFGNVVEYYPSLVTMLAKKRPLCDVEHFVAELHNIMDSLPFPDKIDILARHPDLAGRKLEEKTLTEESQREQHSAGLHQLTEQTKSTFANLNKAYKEKFGFPFVICARENDARSILQQLEVRLKNTSEKEVLTGIQEVKKIARLRIVDLVKD